MDNESWMRSRASFLSAGEMFADLVADAYRGPATGLGLPALGSWYVRDLVGHAHRAIITIEAYYRPQSASAVDLEAAADHYMAALDQSDPAAIAQRGVEAGAALGDDAPKTVRHDLARVNELLLTAAADARVETPVGVMRIADYLPTRTCELVIHQFDLTRALGRPLDLPESTWIEALQLLVTLDVRRGRSQALAAMLTGRSPLGDDLNALAQ